MPSSLWIPTKLTSSPTSSYSNPSSILIPLQLFLGSPSTTLFFCKHVSSLKANFFAHLKALRCISASLWNPALCIKLLFGCFSLTFHPDGFLFLSVTNITKLERLHQATSCAVTGQLVAPPPVASCPPLSHFSTLGILFLSYESH